MEHRIKTLEIKVAELKREVASLKEQANGEPKVEAPSAEIAEHAMKRQTRQSHGRHRH